MKSHRRKIPRPQEDSEEEKRKRDPRTRDLKDQRRKISRFQEKARKEKKNRKPKPKYRQ